jgi:hypothetical protein
MELGLECYLLTGVSTHNVSLVNVSHLITASALLCYVQFRLTTEFIKVTPFLMLKLLLKLQACCSLPHPHITRICNGKMDGKANPVTGRGGPWVFFLRCMNIICI